MQAVLGRIDSAADAEAEGNGMQWLLFELPLREFFMLMSHRLHDVRLACRADSV